MLSVGFKDWPLAESEPLHHRKGKITGIGKGLLKKIRHRVSKFIGGLGHASHGIMIYFCTGRLGRHAAITSYITSTGFANYYNLEALNNKFILFNAHRCES